MAIRICISEKAEVRLRPQRYRGIFSPVSAALQRDPSSTEQACCLLVSYHTRYITSAPKFTSLSHPACLPIQYSMTIRSSTGGNDHYASSWMSIPACLQKASRFSAGRCSLLRARMRRVYSNLRWQNAHLTSCIQVSTVAGAT